VSRTNSARVNSRPLNLLSLRILDETEILKIKGSIRRKTLLAIGLSLALSTLLLHQLVSSLQLKSYRAIEQQSAEKDLSRVAAVLQNALDKYEILSSDWGSWDATYGFVEDRNQAYIDGNLTVESLVNMEMNYLFVVGNDGEIIHDLGIHLKQQEKVTVSQGLLDVLDPSGPVLGQMGAALNASGFVGVDDKVLLISAAPILRSDDSGERRGFFVIGRYLDRDLQEEFETQLQLNLVYPKRRDDGFPERVVFLVDALSAQNPGAPFTYLAPRSRLDVVNEETIEGHVLFPDTEGRPVLLVTAKIPRDVYQAGVSSLNALFFALAAAGAMLIVAVSLLLDRIVLRPLSRLGRDVDDIAQTSDLSKRVSVEGEDELAVLGNATNRMLEQLDITGQKLAAEHARAENLLLNILPSSVAERLKASPDTIAERFDEVSILFADMVGFTEMSSEKNAEQIVGMLNTVFSRFDDLAEDLGLEKIKTMGDCYMVASGLPKQHTNHAQALADMALGMLNIIGEVAETTGGKLSLRIGINSGIVVAGVIGKSKFIYDLWGDTVNIASRMESSGEPGRIQVTEATYALLREEFAFEGRGLVDIKGRGKMTTYYLLGRR